MTFKDFSASHTPMLARRLVVHGNLGGGTAGRADPKRSKEYSISHGVTFSMWKRQVGGRRRKRRVFGEMVFVFPSTVCVRGRCLPGNGWTPARPWQKENEFLVVICSCAQFLLYLLNCLYLKPRVFHLCFSDSLSSPAGWEWASSCGAWCWLGLNHDTTTDHILPLPLLFLCDSPIPSQRIHYCSIYNLKIFFLYSKR